LRKTNNLKVCSSETTFAYVNMFYLLTGLNDSLSIFVVCIACRPNRSNSARV
jgi:hypothetical protein